MKSVGIQGLSPFPAPTFDAEGGTLFFFTPRIALCFLLTAIADMTGRGFRGLL